METTSDLCPDLNNSFCSMKKEADEIKQCLDFLTKKMLELILKAESVIDSGAREKLTKKTSRTINEICERLREIKEDLKIDSDVFADHLTIPYFPTGKNFLKLKFLEAQNPWDFWLYDELVDKNTLQKNLLKKYQNNLLEEYKNPKVTESVCFLDRNKIYRGIVTQVINNDKMMVMDVDSPKKVVVGREKVFIADADACHIHASAIHCQINKDNQEKLWEAELRTLLQDTLKEAILSVQIVERLPGCSPNFLVNVDMQLEGDDSKANLNNWISKRLLPELKKLKEDESDSVFAFLTPEATDPYLPLPEEDCKEEEKIKNICQETVTSSSDMDVINNLNSGHNKDSTQVVEKISPPVKENEKSSNPDTSELNDFVTTSMDDDKESNDANQSEASSSRPSSTPSETQDSCDFKETVKEDPKNSAPIELIQTQTMRGMKYNNDCAYIPQTIVNYVPPHPFPPQPAYPPRPMYPIENFTTGQPLQYNAPPFYPAQHPSNPVRWTPLQQPHPQTRQYQRPAVIENHSVINNNVNIGEPQSFPQMRQSQENINSISNMKPREPARPITDTSYHFELKKPMSLLKPNEHCNISISHVKSPNNFYIHFQNEDYQKLQRLKTEMQNHYSTVELVEFETWQLAKKAMGKFAVCKWPKDDNYYRVEIIDWALGDNQVRVYFVDYGHTENLSFHCLQPLTREFAKMSMAAQRCHMAHLMKFHKGKEWPPDAIQLFKNKVKPGDGKQYSMTVVPAQKGNSTNNSLAVMLYCNRTSNSNTINDEFNKCLIVKHFISQNIPLGLVDENGVSSEVEQYSDDLTPSSEDSKSLSLSLDSDEFIPKSKKFSSSGSSVAGNNAAGSVLSDQPFEDLSPRSEGGKSLSLNLGSAEFTPRQFTLPGTSDFTSKLSEGVLSVDKCQPFEELSPRSEGRTLSSSQSLDSFRFTPSLLPFPQSSEKLTLTELSDEGTSNELTEFSNWDPQAEDYHSERNNPRLDIDDAGVALTNYKARDESRICKFFARNSVCPKKYCTKEHIMPNKDDVTTDREEIYKEAFSELAPLKIGDVLRVLVTAVDDVDRIYFQQNEARGTAVDDPETISMLTKYMNQSDSVREMRRLIVLPAPGQLVLAFDQVTGEWNRARVTDHDDDHQNHVEVCFVDYGTKSVLPLQDLREMEPKYLWLPFQAVECSLANIIPPEDKVFRAMAVQVLKDTIQGNILTARIYDSFPNNSVEVLLEDEKEVGDIGEYLAVYGCAILNPLTWPPPKPTKPISEFPG